MTAAVETPMEPPAWEEQEWCDGGGTCWHAQCIDELARDCEDERLEALETGR